MTSITEEELKELLASAETKRRGFSHVVELYSERIYWQLRHMVQNHEQANDLTQNTFLKAWEAIEGFRGESKISTWLYRIALYEGLNFLKKQKIEHQLFGSDQETEYIMNQLCSDSYFDGDEYEKIFQEAILALPQKQQLVFRLRYYEDMSYNQISSLTGTSEGALKASYHHATKKIEAYIKNQSQASD